MTARHCPACGKSNDGYTGMHGAVLPRNGDYSICVYCLAVSVFVTFGSSLSLRLATEEERMVAHADPKLARTFSRLDQIRAARG